MSKIEHRPNQHAVKTVWGWSHSQTGEQLVSAHGYFEGQYEADGGAKPNQGNPLVEGVSPKPVSGNPKIDTQPVDDYLSNVPGELSFTVEASIVNPIETDTLSYQWQIKMSTDSTYKNLTDGAFTGMTSSTITNTDAITNDFTNARVRCIVSVGSNSVTSTPATIINAA